MTARAQYRRILAFFAVFSCASSIARAEKLILSLSTDRIAITSSFNGAQLVVFGAIERDGATGTRTSDYDVVATVRGPRGAVTVREKKRWGPLWFNQESRIYIGTPAFLSVLSNRALDLIATEEMRKKLLIGVDALVTAQGDRLKSSDPDEPDFRKALMRIRNKQGLFTETSDGVKMLTPQIFRANARLPGAVPLGAYTVDVSVFNDGLQIAKGAAQFSVVRSGAERDIAASARNEPLFYGLGVAAMALFFGWIASQIFRRD